MHSGINGETHWMGGGRSVRSVKTRRVSDRWGCRVNVETEREAAFED